MSIIWSQAQIPTRRTSCARYAGSGTELQFRYDCRWVEKEVQEAVRKGELHGAKCLIAYIDQSDESRTPILVPVRSANLQNGLLHGSTVSIGLRLGTLTRAEDLDAFNDEVRSGGGERLPNWRPDGSIDGLYFLKVDGEPRTATDKGAFETRFETIVTQLAGRADFSEERLFYPVLGLYGLGSQPPRLLSPADQGALGAAYDLKPGENYELRVYHFHPAQEPPAGQGLKVVPSSESIVLCSSPVLETDSRYDLKRVAFHAGDPPRTEYARLGILRVTRASGGRRGKWNSTSRFA